MGPRIADEDMAAIRHAARGYHKPVDQWTRADLGEVLRSLSAQGVQPTHHKKNPRWQYWRQPFKKRTMSIHLERFVQILCDLNGSNDFLPNPSPKLQECLRNLFQGLESHFGLVRHGPACKREHPKCHKIKRTVGRNCLHNLGQYDLLFLFCLRYIVDARLLGDKSDEAKQHYQFFEPDTPLSLSRRKRFRELLKRMAFHAGWRASREYWAYLDTFAS